MNKAADVPLDSDLPIEDLMRIMDVATALRKERETASQQLDLESTKENLRKRLLAAAEVVGDNVTEAEVDVAIEQYFSRLHAFEPPRWSFGVFLAHLYIRRKWVLGVGVPVLLTALVGTWLLFSASSPWSSENRRNSTVLQVAERVHHRRDTIYALTSDSDTLADVDSILAEATTHQKHGDAPALRKLAARLEAIESVLSEEYTVYLVAKGQTGTQRHFTDAAGRRLSGNYLIVEAKNSRGELVECPILNAETRQTLRVKRWAERVPEEVYERIRRDKEVDGILDEIVFSAKRRGQPREEIIIKGSDGKPIERAGQITQW